MATTQCGSSPSAKNYDAKRCCVEYDSGHHHKTSPTIEQIEVARTQYEAFKLSLWEYLPQEPPNHRARYRQKLSKMTPDQFQRLSMDTYDELVRRNESEKPSALPPARDDFHPNRNLARQKISTLPAHRLDDLCSDVFHELGRRYPEITGPNVKKWDELPRVPGSPPPPYEPPAPQVIVGDEPAFQGYLLGFVKKFGGLFGC